MMASSKETGYGSDELEGAAFVRRRVAPKQAADNGRGRKLLAVSAVVLTVGATALAFHATSTAPVLVGSSSPSSASLQAVPNYFVPPVLQQDNRPFLLRTKGKNDLCMDDGGANTAGQARPAAWPCNPSNPNQAFVYDTKTYQLRSARKPTLCLEASSPFTMQTCNPSNANQRFTYNPTTLQFKAPAKANMCLDDGTATRGGSSRFAVYFCDANKADQKFEIVFRDDAQAEQQRVVDAAQDGRTRFQIRAVGKSSLCLDDGGAMGPGDTQMRLTTCAPDSTSQSWVWDPTSSRIRSATKRGLCLDDGGATAPNSPARMTLSNCDTSSTSQQLVYNKTQQSLSNPTKNNLCVDDGGAWTPWSFLRMQLASCDMYNANQHYEFVVLPPPPPVAAPAILQGGREFLLRLKEKNSLCLSDGGGANAGDAQLTSLPCNPNDVGQAFVYDTSTNQLRSARTPIMCLDDGGVNGPYSSAVVALAVCDVYSSNQRFTYDPTTQQLTNPMKNGLCLDDGGGTRAGDSQPGLRECDDWSRNQRFEIRVRDDAKAELQRVVDAVTSGSYFLLRAVGKDNLCVDDGGAITSRSRKMGVSTCSFDNMDQVFQWDASMQRIRSFYKFRLCMDDGGTTTSGSATMVLATCRSTSTDQSLRFDPLQMQFESTNKNNLCVDDGGSWTTSLATMQLKTCDPSSANQHFEFVVLPTLPVAPTPAVLQTDREILLSMRGKNALCVDDGGGTSAGATKVLPWTCNPSSDNQAFVYDATTNQIRSARKPGLCLDDAGTATNGQFRATLGTCDPSSQNQRFVYDPATFMIRNPFKNNLCLDDGGASRAGSSQLTMWTCDPNNPNQKFDVKYRDDAQAAQQRALDAVLLNRARFQIRAVGKPNLCVDDGGGTSNGATQFWLVGCDPRNANQIFVWDTSASLIRSASKGLCVDDTNSPGKMWLWACDAGNTNQKFVYDKTTQAIRNPAKPNECIDDGGAWAPGTAKMLTLACDKYNPNQRFELLPL